MASDANLPTTFRYAQSRRCGVSDRALRRLVRDGCVERVSRGLYRRTDAEATVDVDLLEIAHRVPAATLCLVSALARHGLTDQIPASVDVAIPRGRRQPRLQAPVTWHHFSTETFYVGRQSEVLAPGEDIGIYSPERCVVDAFRLRHLQGRELAVEALRSWLGRKGSKPSSLMSMARQFPQAETPLRNALEILL